MQDTTEDNKTKKKKSKTVNNSQLIRLVAKRCAYKVYEVEDVLKALSLTIQDQIAEGMKVKLEDIGTFYMKERKGYWMHNNMLNEKVLNPAKRVAMYKPDNRMRRFLNPDDTSITDEADSE